MLITHDFQLLVQQSISLHDEYGSEYLYHLKTVDDLQALIERGLL